MIDREEDRIDIDVVIIGVNTEATIGRCIESVYKSNYTKGRVYVYYVDGGSTDRSVEIARGFSDVKVIELDPEYPTPGLGRNAGWRAGNSQFVQFLDSDTVLDPEWLSKAVEAMGPDVGAVRGNREEMHPEASVFNWIGNLEWNAPPGECDAFGGDVLIRRSVLEETGGYDEVLVGGEDPELSQRVRLRGWKIIQIDEPMTRHDLAMTRVSQYWRRGYRTGYGYAAVSTRYLKAAKGFWFYEFLRILVRGGGSTFLYVAGLSGSLLTLWSLALFLPATLLLFYPRIFRISYFMKDKNLPVDRAKIYAWHCSFIVIPEFFGIMRYFYGVVTGRPLRNRRRRLRTAVSGTSCLLLIITLILANVSCSIPVRPVPTPSPDKDLSFEAEPARTKEFFATTEKIQELSKSVSDEYLLGPGDVLSLKVWQRPDISDDNIVVGPDGIITVPRIGNINVSNRSRESVVKEIKEKLSFFYDDPEISLSIKEFKNNKAFVLGRVANPGVVNFPGRGTLLEALALAGGLPVLEKQAFLTKCAIIRGKDMIIWIDLKELLDNGNMALNARIQNNDVIYIPESKSELVYVMGEVFKPGAISLHGQLTYMDALMLSGGPKKSADITKTYIIRFDGRKSAVKEIDLKRMLETGDFRDNFLLQDNDVIYVAEKGMGRFNYALKQLMPFLDVLQLSTTNLETFGVMPEFRERVWGQ